MGIAPLLVGTVLVTIIGRIIFDTPEVSSTAGRRQLDGAVFHIRDALNRPSGLIWAYLLFTIANAMMPSASDHQLLMPVLFYSALAIVAYIT